MTTKDAVKKIKSLRPDKLGIRDRDGAISPVVIEQLGRQKWQRLEEMLDGMAWTKVSCMTGKGELLGEVHADDAPAREVDREVEISPVDEVERLAAIMLRVQEGSMKLQTTQIDRALTAFEKMAEVMTDAMITVRDSYEMAMKLQAAALTAASGGEVDGADAQMKEMLQMAMMLKGLIPSKAPPKTTTPPKPGASNGQTKPPTT